MSFGDIIAYVVALIQEVVQFILSVLSALIQVLNEILSAIWNTLVAFANAVVSLFQTIGHFFVSLWENYIKPVIDKLIGWYNQVKAWLQRTLGPLLRIVERIRKWYVDHIAKWVKLAQEILSVIRVFLSALRLLGVKWAAKLDADIAKIQSFITGVFTGILAVLNAASTWLNFAIDPLGILRRDFLGVSLFSNIAAVARSVSFGKDRYLSASEAANTDGDRAMIGGGSAILTRNQDGSVTFSDASQRVNAGLDSAWDYYGGPARKP